MQALTILLLIQSPGPNTGNPMRSTFVGSARFTSPTTKLYVHVLNEKPKSSVSLHSRGLINTPSAIHVLTCI